MKLKDRIAELKPLIEKEINNYLKPDRPKELYDPLRELFSRGGKRIRPAICMLSAEAVGGQAKDALTTGVAIEMVHNFTLLHDDIVDRSELRRGEPCIHIIYGDGLAINAGDGLFALAFDALSSNESILGSEKSNKILSVITKAVLRVCEGQAMDIGWVENKKWGITENQYLEMLTKKTGALISCATECGGIIGTNKKNQIRALKVYGENIGVAFQIQDDVLNLSGDVAEYGKEIGGDINEGKRTLIIIHALNNCTLAERKLLIDILDKKKNTKEEIKKASGIINKYKSIEYAISRAEEYSKRAKAELKNLQRNDTIGLLEELSEFVIKRRK